MNSFFARWAIGAAMALLSLGAGGGLLAGPAQAAVPTSMTVVSLTANPVATDGSSTTTASVTLKDAGAMPVPGETVTFTSTDPAEVIQTLPEGPPGTYSAKISNATALGSVTIKATDTAASLSNTGTLNQIAGPATRVVVSLSPNPVVADGTSSTATATVTDTKGHPLSGETITFSPGGVGANTGSGTYQATIPGSTTVAPEGVTATDAATGAFGSATLTRTIGAASHIAVGLSPSAVIANGTSTTTATATVTDAEGHRVPGESIVFAPGGQATDRGNGIYTATIKSTTSPGPVTITAFDTSTGVPPGSATLTQQQGTAGTSTDLMVADTNPIAGQTVTLIGTVFSDQSNIPPRGTITFENGGKPIGGCVRSVAPTSPSVTVFCQTSFSASTANLTVVFTPSSTASVSGSASPTTTIEIGKPPPTHSTLIRGTITALMQWSFVHSPRSTSPLVFVIGGVRIGATVTIQCHGKGCPYSKAATLITRPKPCKRTKKHKCPVTHPGTVNLMRRFHNHHLQPGAQVTIKITQPSWIGKFYMFTMRASKGPRISIGCIAPGSNRLGVGC